MVALTGCQGLRERTVKVKKSKVKEYDKLGQE